MAEYLTESFFELIKDYPNAKIAVKMCSEVMKIPEKIKIVGLTILLDNGVIGSNILWENSERKIDFFTKEKMVKSFKKCLDNAEKSLEKP